MGFFDIILLSIGLAMDCFAVSISKGFGTDIHNRASLRWDRPMLMAVLFGVFQAGMPLIGYFVGTVFTAFFKTYAPWIALGLLAFIGGKMIWESFHEDLEERNSTDWSLNTLLSLSVATSIDALATGVIFIPVPEILGWALLIIALCCFIFSVVGYLIGVFVGTKFKLNVELIGGIILVLIGLKICIEGVCF